MVNVIISEELRNKIIAKLKTVADPKVYWDHQDEVDLDNISKAWDSEDEYPIDRVYEGMEIDTYDIEVEHLKNILDDFKEDLAIVFECDEDSLDMDEIARDWRDEFLDYFSVDIDIKSIMPDIPVRLELISNYDCINSHWLESQGGYSAQESYFGDVVRVLHLNPHLVKDWLKERGVDTPGRWYNTRKRMPFVEMKSFWVEMENRSCGANLLTIIGKMDSYQLLSANRNKLVIEVGKGNMIGFFSSMQGGGSVFECPLIKPIRIDLSKKKDYPYWRLVIDHKGFGYTIKETYGVSSDFFDGDIAILSKK